MKKFKSLAVRGAQLFAAVVMVMGMISCNKDFDVDEGVKSVRSLDPTPNNYYYGERMINDSVKCDSVITPEGVVEKVNLKFRITAREDREVIVENFNNPNAGESFSSDRRLIESRKEGNFLIYAYGTNPHKGVEVGSTGETVSYDAYEEIATYVPTSHEFSSQGWEVENTSDVFVGAEKSSKEGYTELDYTNGIKATYTGVSTSKVFNLEENIAFFAPGDVPVPKVDHYEAVGERTDFPTYTSVVLEKTAVYTDGNRVVMGKFSANLPIAVNPLTNWTITVDNLGTYVSNAFSGTQTGKEAKTAEKFFSYNNYSYRYANTVAGQENALSVSVPNDIVFKDDDVEYKFANTNLNVAKGNETTTQHSTNVYAYNCVANVTFGANQSVNLPGTINIKAATVDHYKVINASRNDYPTYTAVALEKIAVYTDGTEKSVGKFNASLPITVSPLTNWTITVDALGTYVANAFSGNQTGKVARTAEKFFNYNQYTYRYANTVAGQENALSVSVPNDIIFNDGDVEYKFSNTSLNVAKGNETTTQKGDNVYAYNVVANVTFGASQAVTLPGTINVDASNHEHGKVKDVIFTTTQDENKSYYKSVCVIVFEDGYRSIGMTDNGSKVFSFTMSSTTNGVNSAVYDGKWVPSKANDDSTCMIWRNESGAKKRVLDYISATAQAWNNGHNTIIDVRRSYNIIDGGYGVSLSLNGSAGQTLHF